MVAAAVQQAVWNLRQTSLAQVQRSLFSSLLPMSATAASHQLPTSTGVSSMTAPPIGECVSSPSFVSTVCILLGVPFASPTEVTGSVTGTTTTTTSVVAVLVVSSCAFPPGCTLHALRGAAHLQASPAQGSTSALDGPLFRRSGWIAYAKGSTSTSPSFCRTR